MTFYTTECSHPHDSCEMKYSTGISVTLGKLVIILVIILVILTFIDLYD